MLERTGVRVLASSERLGWQSVFASEQEENAFSGDFAPAEDLLLVMHIDGPAHIEVRDGARWGRHIARPGTLHLHPAGEKLGVRLHETLHTLHVYIRRAIIERVAQNVILDDPARVRISARIVESDPILLAMLEAIRGLLQDGDDTAPLHVDYLAQTIACHLLQRYSNARLRLPVEWSDRAKRDLGIAVDYLHANIGRRVTLTHLTHATGRSESQLNRVFKAETGLTPHRYLTRLRLEKAYNLLTRSRMRLCDIAMDCGFSSQEHLSRAFRRHYGITPSQSRRSA